MMIFCVLLSAVCCQCDNYKIGHFYGDESRLLLTNGECYIIKNSFFEHISFSGSGGAIHIQIPNSFIGVFFTTFYACQATSPTESRGGAMLLRSNNVSITHTCASTCLSYMDSHSYYFNGALDCLFMYNSITSCGPEGNIGNINAIDFTGCRTRASYFNSSHNYQVAGTGIYVYSSLKSSLSFSSLASNYAEAHGIVCQSVATSELLTFNSVNIVNCICKTSAAAVIWTMAGRLRFESCYIRLNSFSTFVFNANPSIPVEFVDTNIQRFSSTAAYVTHNCFDISMDQPSIKYLLHTGHCEAEFKLTNVFSNVLPLRSSLVSFIPILSFMLN